ncbi:hypothetical protein AABK37_38765, partial [Hassallia sp. VBCCA 56010]
MEVYKLDPKKFTGYPKPPSYIDEKNIVKFNYQAIKARKKRELDKREQARRDEIRKRTAPVEPPDPTRVTSRNPSWEQPTPTSKRPTQPPPPSAAKPPPTPNTSGARVSPNVQPTAK